MTKVRSRQGVQEGSCCDNGIFNMRRVASEDEFKSASQRARDPF